MRRLFSSQAPDVTRDEKQVTLVKAERAMQQAIQLHPQDSRAFYYLGECYASEQQWAKAADAYHSVIKLTPVAAQTDAAMAGAYDALAEALRKLGKNEEAAEDSAKAQRIRPSLPKAWANTAGDGNGQGTDDSHQQELRSMMVRPGDSEPSPAHPEAAYTKSVSLP